MGTVVAAVVEQNLVEANDAKLARERLKSEASREGERLGQSEVLYWNT